MLLATSWAVPAGAGEPSPPESADPEALAEGDVYSEKIVVTGQLQERSLDETFDSVAVASGLALERSTTRDLYDLASTIPNFSQSFGDKGFSIRGIDQRGFGAGTGLLVSVKVDGATLPTNESSFFGPYSAWDLDQVEVFRGPQSTQQGRNSLAGAVVIRSADPSYEPEFRGRLSYGNLETWGASAMVNVPLAADKAAFRLSVDQNRSDGWVENPTLGVDDYDARESLTVRGKLRFDPSDRFRGTLAYTYADSTGGEDAILPFLFPEDRFNFSNDPAEEGSEHNLLSLELAWDLNDRWSLESLTSTYDQDYLRLEDTDQSAIPGNVLNINRSDESVSQQLRLVYDTGARIRGVLGAYYADIDEQSLSAATLPGPLFGLPDFVTINGFLDEANATENVAVFGEFDVAFESGWGLTAGLRYDDEERTTETEQSSTFDPPILPPQPGPREVLESSYDALLPKLAVSYGWSDSVSTSFSVQRGYRAGGRSLSFLSRQLSDFDPEFTTNYELSVRAQSSDRRVRFSGNAFYIDWEDQQVSIRTLLDTEFDRITVNAGSSEVSGLEARVDFSPAENLTFFVSGGWVDTEFSDFIDADVDLSGNQFPFAPEWSGTLGVHWQFAERWVLDATVNGQSGFFSDAQNRAEFEVDDRTLVHTKLGYIWPTAAVHVWARNVFDEDYLLLALPGETRAGEPQRFGLEVSFGL